MSSSARSANATRLAGQGNDALCPECWELAGLENTVLDIGMTENIAKERDWLLAKAVKQGSNEARIRADFRHLFAKEATA